MGVHSGKFGVVNNQKAVRNWTLNDVTTSQRSVHSGSAFGSFRSAGVKDWTGTFDAYGGVPTVMPGETFSFQGYTAPGDDVVGSNGISYSGTAICQSVAITWDWAGGAPLSYVVNFASGAGAALTVADGPAISDATVEVPPAICGLDIQYGASGAEADWENVTNAVLTISSDLQTYVNSSTDCNTGRKAGPIDFTLAITEQEEDELQTLGTDIRVLCFTDPTDYWLLEWCHVESYTNLNVDIETGAIISKTANLSMSGSDGSVLGRISIPGVTTGTPWWGTDFPP